MLSYYQTLQERKQASGDEGFTLIELLIVIVVLGILAAVVVFALGSVTGSAKQSACVADAKTMETAVSAYNAQAQQNGSIGLEASFPTTTGLPAGDIVPPNAAGSLPANAAQAALDAATLQNGTNAKLLLTAPAGSTTAYLNSWPSTTNGYALSLMYAANGTSTPVVAAGPSTTAGDVAVFIQATNGTYAAPVSYNAEVATTGAGTGCYSSVL
jgi:general secretion pathway protein G